MHKALHMYTCIRSHTLLCAHSSSEFVDGGVLFDNSPGVCVCVRARLRACMSMYGLSLTHGCGPFCLSLSRSPSFSLSLSLSVPRLALSPPLYDQTYTHTDARTHTRTPLVNELISRCQGTNSSDIEVTVIALYGVCARGVCVCVCVRGMRCACMCVFVCARAWRECMCDCPLRSHHWAQCMYVVCLCLHVCVFIHTNRQGATC